MRDLEDEDEPAMAYVVGSDWRTRMKVLRWEKAKYVPESKGLKVKVQLWE